MPRKQHDAIDLEPAYLVTNDVVLQDTAHGSDDSLGTLLVLPVVTVVLVIVVAVCVWRLFRQRDPAEAAFWGLSWRMRLRRSQRHALRKIAKIYGVQPVVLLLSPSAFDGALQAAQERADHSSVQCVQTLRRKLFSKHS